MNISSTILHEAVESISKLPGIGKKSALRIALHLINGNVATAVQIASKIKDLENIRFCNTCHNISDNDICDICNSRSRNRSTICIVENVRDLIAIENSQQFNGLYHVLGALISPMDGISPQDVNIKSLIDRIEKDEMITELIMAISPNIEGETTVYYISNLLPKRIKISLISRGVAFGTELEYSDELTLGRSILTRIPYNSVNEIF
ncbi:MAG: recombination protein RecR [Saprospiraceae bacterium]|nr:recombination protein RecR [Saprospiraceae bacterium]